MTREIRLYGLPEDALRERLADLMERPAVAVTLSYHEGHGLLTLNPGGEEAEEVIDEIVARLGAFVYSYEGRSLAAAVVGLLADHGLTLATAESCTGGLIAAALTDVPGASRVFGTGVVSYSNECKQQLLTVSSDTLNSLGAVSAETAGQMARGVRQKGNATIGVSVTGEAGPQPAEDLPVGTVYIALADKKRTWVEELHLDGPNRASIRRQAADRVLWLVWQYLSAYPAVMAGGENNQVLHQRSIPRANGGKRPHLLSAVLPWRGDSLRLILLKGLAWLVAAVLLLGGLQLGYQHLVQPNRNRQLQSSLGEMYHQTTDLTDGAVSSEEYPEGLLPVFRNLYDKNSDVAGWLHIPGTQIDYPVMNYAAGYYKNHSFLKEYSIYGQPYFGPSARQICLVYGQNTEDGQMFSELIHYRRPSFLQEHDTIQCNTLTANQTWQVFAVVVLNDRNPGEFALPTEEFASEEEYLWYLDQVVERSLITSDVALTADDRVLVLSTDAQEEYGFSGARLAVFARLVEGEMIPATYGVNHQVRMPYAYYQRYRTTGRAPTTERTTTPTATDSDKNGSTTAGADSATPTKSTDAEEGTEESTDSTTLTTLPSEGTTLPGDPTGNGE